MTSNSCSKLSTINYQLFCSFRFKRSHVDGETVLYIRLQQSFVSFVDFLNRNNFDIRGDVMLAAKVEHLLRFGDAADGRAGETAASHDEAECRNAQWFGRSADKRKVTIASEQVDIGVDVVIG